MDLKEIVAGIEAEGNIQCNCDLDQWQPEKSSGHTWTCRIHKLAVGKFRDQQAKQRR